MKYPKNTKQGYTLIETLVATAVIMLVVGAAASLSLAMVTQEEMSERMVIASNYLENAATLYHLGLDVTVIERLLPAEPVIDSLDIVASSVNVAGLGNLNVADITISYQPSDATAATTGEYVWTGGVDGVARTQTVRVFRSSF